MKRSKEQIQQRKQQNEELFDSFQSLMKRVVQPAGVKLKCRTNRALIRFLENRMTPGISEEILPNLLPELQKAITLHFQGERIRLARTFEEFCAEQRKNEIEPPALLLGKMKFWLAEFDAKLTFLEGTWVWSKRVFEETQSAFIELRIVEFACAYHLLVLKMRWWKESIPELDRSFSRAVDHNFNRIVAGVQASAHVITNPSNFVEGSSVFDQFTVSEACVEAAVDFLKSARAHFQKSRGKKPRALASAYRTQTILPQNKRAFHDIAI